MLTHIRGAPSKISTSGPRTHAPTGQDTSKTHETAIFATESTRIQATQLTIAYQPLVGWLLTIVNHY